MLVKFTGENASLQAYGFRFEKDKPVEVKDDKVLKKLKERGNFEVMEEKAAPRKKGEGTVATKPEEGETDADAGESKGAE
ncbi:hypothetical protein [Brevibacillus choshinensis]|uniref:Uncharacterized protein n=1 Tax=Brevibacillus choshinensis TaxID=54911 RepID=A0ABX7FGD6_BRECH|nr:hypothetical protein [Brevibacillus choshinensis]QRG65254.1 hypothetical protein JNE38_16555 [Brevibacillus choshinensis]